MNKLIFSSILMIIINHHIYSQSDEYKNKGFFNLSKVSFHFVDNISEHISTPLLGYLEHYETDNAYAYSINTINGWFVFPWLSAGVGVGYEYQNTMKFHLVPAYIDLRAYLSKNGNAFYLFADYGVIAGLNNNVGTGEMMNIGLGYKFFITKTLCITAGLGFNSYTLLEVSGYPEPDPIHDFSVSSTSINIGFLF